MSERRIDVFFYGLFMDADLLRGKGVVPLNLRTASLDGFGLRIGKRVAFVPAREERSYGMVMGLTHEELKRNSERSEPLVDRHRTSSTRPYRADRNAFLTSAVRFSSRL